METNRKRHMRWYGMYEKLWKHILYMKNNQNRRRTAGVPQTPPHHMKSYEKLPKAIKSMRSVIRHMKWYGMYEKLWKYTYIYMCVKSNQKRRRTAGVPQTPPPTDRCQAMRNKKNYENEYKRHENS